MPKIFYSLQAFRGFAAVLVVLCHAKLLNVGSSGVDFFFVLSGFIIYSVHRADVGQPARVGNFFRKRFFRVYPVYFVALMVRCLLSLSGYTTGERIDAIQILRAVFLLPAPPPREPIVSVSWTLSYEALFYILFALVILLPKRLAAFAFGAWVVALILKMGFVADAALPFWAEFLLSWHNLEFVLGVVAAMTLPRAGSPYARQAQALGIALFVGIAVAKTFALSAFEQRPTLSVLFGVASALIVWGSASLELRKPSSWPWLCLFLGDASYSIYLTHSTLVFNALKIFDRMHFDPATLVALRLLAVVGSIGAGCVVHLALEKPLLRLFHKRNVAVVGSATRDAALAVAPAP